MGGSEAFDGSPAVRTVEAALGCELPREVLERFPGAQEQVRQAVDVRAKDSSSVAIVDRTALWRTTSLLSGELDAIDPFMALADLATILGAVIFDDRVIVLGDEETVGLAARANGLLGLESVIRPTGFDPYAPEASDDRSSSALMQELPLLSAQRELVRASRERAQWLDLLRGNWEKLLPGVRQFPAHHEGRVLEAIEMYKDMPYDNYQLFIIEDREWRFSSEPLDNIIIDNDFRALYYERLVQCFTAMVTDDDAGPSVHYASGCLRSPMLLARAKYAAGPFREPTTTIGRLQQSWEALESANALAAASTQSLVLPFWADAVLAASRRPADIPRIVSKYRSQARGFRKRRNELDGAIQNGDTNQLEQRVLALRGDASKLSREVTSTLGAAAGFVAEVASWLFVPVPVPGIGAASAFGVERLARMVPAYLFRPHLHVLMSMGKDARSMTRPLARAAELFELPSARGTTPSIFLEGLGQVAWVA